MPLLKARAGCWNLLLLPLLFVLRHRDDDGDVLLYGKKERIKEMTHLAAAVVSRTGIIKEGLFTN